MGATWQIRLNGPCSEAMQAVTIISGATCYLLSSLSLSAVDYVRFCVNANKTVDHCDCPNLSDNRKRLHRTFPQFSVVRLLLHV